jgi:hypothetical protein
MKMGYIARITAVTLAIVMSTVPSASAAGFHSESNAYEDSNGNGYSGVSVYRTDIDLRSANPCIYQTQWIMDNAAQNRVELGPGWGSACFAGIANGDWYFGYGIGGTFNLVSVRPANVGQTHVFSMYRAGDVYVSYVDSTEIGRTTWPTWFDMVSAGLESYMSLAIVTAHTYDSLQYSWAAGPYQYWAGEDANRVDPQMCGRWVSPTTWKAGQNVSC